MGEAKIRAETTSKLKRSWMFPHGSSMTHKVPFQRCFYFNYSDEQWRAVFLVAKHLEASGWF